MGRSDYQKWRAFYDSFAPEQTTGGVTAQAVYQSADDPNDITVSHDISSMEAARAFVSSPKLQAAMAQAGVVGAPTIWFAEKR